MKKPAHFNFRLIPNGKSDIITVNKITYMDDITPSQLLEYLEVDSKLYALERESKRKQKALAKRVQKKKAMIKYIALGGFSCITAIGLCMFDAVLFVVGASCACISAASLE